MSAPKKVTRVRHRARPRVVAFVKPQWLDHEAQAVLDVLREQVAATPDNGDSVPLVAALDELTRALSESREGRR